VVGSLQNIESAEAAGDRYRTFPSLMANGIGSVVAALFGSVFPTTIYIGHPGWKRLGARAGYSALNGLFISFLCFTGTIQSVLGLIPIEAGIGILLYIGIIIVAQAFQENTERTCSSGGARDCSGIGSLGTADGGNRSASCRRIAFRNRFGSLCSEFSDSRHDRTRTRVYLYLHDPRSDWGSFDRKTIHRGRCVVLSCDIPIGDRDHSRLQFDTGRRRESVWAACRSGVFAELFDAGAALLRRG